MKKLLALILLILVGNSYGQNKFLRAGATGSGNGNDWTNAYTTIAALETGLARGATGYVAAGAYTGQIFNTPASGTSVITIKKATVADNGTDTGWSDSYASGQATFSGAIQFQSPYWVIDGVTGGGPGSWTTNLGFKIVNTADFPNLFFDSGNITIRHVETQGQYSSLPKYQTGNDSAQTRGNNGTGPILMSYCYFHDAGRCIFFAGSNNMPWTVEYTYLGTYWSENNQHSEIISDRSTSLFTFRWGVVTYVTGTGGFMATNDSPPSSSTIELYGNIFINLGTGPAWQGGANGFIGSFSSNVAQLNWKVYNNSFINFPSVVEAFGFTGSSPSGNQARNNLFYNIPSGVGAGSGWTESFSHFINSSSAGTNATTGSGNPFVSIDPTNANFGKLNANTTAGTALAVPYNTDMYGNIRSTWTRGAVEFAAAGDPFPAISSASINAAGTQVTIVFSEAVQVGAGLWNGWVLNLNGGNITIPAQTPSGSGTTRTYTFSSVRTVGAGETGSIVYTQPGNGIEDSALQDLPTGSTVPVTNNSTVLTTDAPSFSPAAGSYFGTQNVIMTSSTPGATIRYTTNGTDPTASSTQYTAGATGIPTSAFTNYKAKAFANLLLDSGITSAVYEIGTWGSGAAWKNIVVPQQTGSFTWTFRASASSTTSGGIIGLSPTPSTAQNDLAHIARFGPTGTIQARNNTAFAAVNNFPYVAGTTYEFVFNINLAASTYSMTVAQIGGSPVVIASNYTNNATAIGIGEVDNVGISVPASGTMTVSQMSFGGVTSIPTLTSATLGANGTTLTLGFSEAVIYGTGGNGGWTMSASGGAVTLTPTASPTTFTTSRAISMGETGTISYVQPGNGVEASSGGGDLQSRSAFAFNNQSTVDLTPPTPNPMTFSAQPSAVSSFSVTMTASVATDANNPSVQYYFDETSANPGGVDSNWQTSRTYTNNGLSPGIQYTYRVLARDSASTLNQTTPSGSFNVTTPIIAGGKVITPAKESGAGFINP